MTVRRPPKKTFFALFTDNGALITVSGYESGVMYMARLILIMALVGFSPFWLDTVQAEETDKGAAAYSLPPLVVTATRMEEPWFAVPYSVEALNSARISNDQQSRTVPEALKEIPGVMVQKTAHGQGSPYIRGLTGYRTLLLIDGIRLNNSVFRDGPNQYWNTVDPFGIQRMELVKGPSSVLYGSDAVGGTLNVITRKVLPDERICSADLVYRYSGADNSHVGRVEAGLRASDAMRFSAGFSYKDFGDVRAAGIGIQPYTGYDEIDSDFEMEYRVSGGRKIVLAHQRVKQDDIWRTHKTIYARSWEGTTVGADRKYATDQRRNLTYIRYQDQVKGGIVDSADLSLSFQRQKEDRDRIRNNYKQELEGFDVGAAGLTGQFSSNLQEMGMLTCGFEYYRDSVDSYLRKYLADGTLSAVEIQGSVADDARYDLAGLYLQDEIFFYDKLSILVGGRYTYAKARANRVKDPLSGTQIALSRSWDNVTGNLRGQYFLVPEYWSLYGGITQGFRAPNLSDLTSFEAAFQDSIETPGTELSPEKYTNYEIGIKGQTGRCTVQAAYFYTDMADVIVRYPTGAVLNGDRELKKANAANGYIQGCEISLNYKIPRGFEWYGMFTWMEGRVDQPQFDASGNLVFKEDYVSKLQPLTTILGVRYVDPSDWYWAEGLVTLVGKQSKLAYTDREDTGRIPPGGNPGYTVATLRGGIKIGKHLQAAVAFENVFNEEYRVLGSGQNEPGRNLIVTLTGRI